MTVPASIPVASPSGRAEVGRQQETGPRRPHCHGERNHHGLDNCLIFSDPKLVREGGGVKRRERLGGLQNHYYRAAA
jgi:hypothetical protein